MRLATVVTDIELFDSRTRHRETLLLLLLAPIQADLEPTVHVMISLESGVRRYTLLRNICLGEKCLMCGSYRACWMSDLLIRKRSVFLGRLDASCAHLVELEKTAIVFLRGAVRGSQVCLLHLQ